MIQDHCHGFCQISFSQITCKHPRTPLQNSLMELWSLLHFLMPYIFRSRKEFSYWFANPMTNMIEDGTSQNENMVNRLHGIIRPFVLRRLKKDVETQLPGKFEHIVKCQLSRRQVSLFFHYSTYWIRLVATHRV
jgi:E1A-binding protein p400